MIRKHSGIQTAEIEYTAVEQAFIQRSGIEKTSTRIPYIVVENFPQLGLFTALRFLEWVSANPEGVISLPTGKTPEFFIKWTEYLLENWNKKGVADLRGQYGLEVKKKPDLRGLHFVQIDEFYPISSKQHNSFYDYVNKYYIEKFGLNKANALLISSDEIPLHQDKHFSEVFPGGRIDLSLRYRDPRSPQEELQKSVDFHD